MNLNIDYERAIDFEHCADMHEAGVRLSKLTNILNQIIVVRQDTKKKILSACSSFKGEELHKLSWENKMIRLSELSGSSEWMELWQDADSAYRQVKNKQDQVFEDIMALKKMIEVTPR
jgi:hypothetical protein